MPIVAFVLRIFSVAAGSIRTFGPVISCAITSVTRVVIISFIIFFVMWILFKMCWIFSTWKKKENEERAKKNIIFQPAAIKKDCLSSQLILPARRLNLERQSVTEPFYLIKITLVLEGWKRNGIVSSHYTCMEPLIKGQWKLEQGKHKKNNKNQSAHNWK